MLDEKALKYYRTLRLPSRLSSLSKYVYMFMIFIVLTIYTLLLQSNKANPEKFLLTLLIHMIMISILPVYLKLLISYIKTRHCLNIAFFLLAPGIPIEILGVFANVYGLLYVVVPLLGLMVIRSFTGSQYKSFTLIVYTLTAEIILSLINDLSIYALVIRSTLTVVSITISLYYMRIISGSCKEFDIFKIANAWIKSMLLSMDEDFSNILNSIGLESQIDTYALLFKTKSKKIAWLVPQVHFGPFRNVGSSALPHIFDQLTKNTGIIPFIFHGAGSHERNLVSSYESLRYAEEIIKKLNSVNEFTEDVMYKPFRVYSDHLEALVLQTNSTSFIAISAPVVGNDDIPFEIQLKALELGRIYEMKDVVIIDCHNIEGTFLKNSKEYEDIIIASLSRTTSPCRTLGVGYGESYVKGYVNGLCSDMIKTLTIKCDDHLYAIIYLYGNNAVIGVRETLRRLAINMGFSDAEIVTADDHICSGITFKQFYQAIELNTHLIKAVESALKMSINSIDRCTVSSARITVRSKIVGPKIFELLELAKNTSRKVIKYIIISFSLVYVLSLVLYIYSFYFS